MKELNQLELPEDLKYSKEHEWVREEGETVLIGITDFAQDQLGDIVFVELPEEGSAFSKGEEFSNLESVKAVSEVYMPVSGQIIKVNIELEDAPELVNNDPYAEGWLIEVKPEDPTEMNELLDKDGYLEMLKGEG
ncbi:MAG: glycine cleavage system protein GcvH [Desulfohalobiaceae bacterium]|nr:glycine cleavage system protein GcvH [Desulfohalobiaceae bacterium]